MNTYTTKIVRWSWSIVLTPAQAKNIKARMASYFRFTIQPGWLKYNRRTHILSVVFPKGTTNVTECVTAMGIYVNGFEAALKEPAISYTNTEVCERRGIDLK